MITTKIPDVTIEWLQERYEIHYPVSRVRMQEDPDPEIVSKRTGETLSELIRIGSRNFTHEDIVYAMEHPEILPKEMEKIRPLTYDEIADHFYEKDGKLYSRLTHIEQLGESVRPMSNRRPIAINSALKILRERVDQKERNARVEKLEIEVKELLEFKDKTEKLFKRLGIE